MLHTKDGYRVPEDAEYTSWNVGCKRQSMLLLRMLFKINANFKEKAGKNYMIPSEWIRFGVKVNPVFAKVNEIWDTWNTAFHGCQPKNVLSILKHRSLLIPNDILSDVTKLSVCASRDVNQKCYFLSPSIGYSAHPWYARPQAYTTGSGNTRYAQTALVSKVGNFLGMEIKPNQF